MDFKGMEEQGEAGTGSSKREKVELSFLAYVSQSWKVLLELVCRPAQERDCASWQTEPMVRCA